MFGGDETGAVVIDLGCSTKFGYGGDDTPKAHFSSTVGYTEAPDGSSSSASAAANKKMLFGSDLRVFRPNMEVDNFIVHGCIENWDCLERLLAHGYNAIHADAAEHPVLMSSPSYAVSSQREKLAEIMFETYGAPAFYIAKTPVLGAFSVGRSTACVVDIGESSTRVSCVYDGYVLNKTTHFSEVGGGFLTGALQDQLLRSKAITSTLPRYAFTKVPVKAGLSSGSAAPNADTNAMDIDPVGGLMTNTEAAVHGGYAGAGRFEILRKNITGTASYHQWAMTDIFDDMKKSVLEVHETGFDDNSAPPEVQYELPDGQLIRIKSLRYSLPELHFRSDYVDHFRASVLAKYQTPSMPSISQNTINRIESLTTKTLSPPQLTNMIVGSLTASPPETRRDLCPNIVLTGGGSNLRDLHKRLHWEMLANIPSAFRPRIVAPPAIERQFAAWIGGSVLSSLGTFQQMWISKAEYEEEGAFVVEKKCL